MERECPVGKMQKVQSLERSLSILECFTVSQPEMSVSEISERIGLPRPTAARLINTLEEHGYLTRNNQSRKYSLGIKLFRLGVIVQNSIQLTTVATPFLKNLQSRINETVYLDVIDGYHRLCILSFESNQAIRSVVPVGQRSPLYAGADGKVLLAYQPEKTVQELIEQTGLRPLTQNTITDRDTLLKELALIREKGYALSFSECSPDSVGISCAIRDGSGQVMAGISISLPQYRANGEIIDTLLQELKQEAKQLSRQLGSDPV